MDLESGRTIEKRPLCAQVIGPDAIYGPAGVVVRAAYTTTAHGAATLECPSGWVPDGWFVAEIREHPFDLLLSGAVGGFLFHHLVTLRPAPPRRARAGGGRLGAQAGHRGLLTVSNRRVQARWVRRSPCEAPPPIASFLSDPAEATAVFLLQPAA